MRTSVLRSIHSLGLGCNERMAKETRVEPQVCSVLNNLISREDALLATRREFRNERLLLY